MYDIAIIGAGVSGCAIARELSKYRYQITVIEKESDVCEGTSKANSGIVHSGFDNEPGSLMAKMNVRGNAMMGELAEELDFPFRRNGSLVLCFDETKRAQLEALLEKGRKNQVPGLKILSGKEVREMEPAVSKETTCALYAPTGGIVCPFGLTIALAENAIENGATFQLNTAVTAIDRGVNGYVLQTDKGTVQAKVVVNAAGVCAAKFHNMVSENKMHIVARKGEYCLMDKAAGSLVDHTIFQLPTVYGKGVLVTPTVHGNLLTGPTAADIEDLENTSTTAEGMADVMRRGQLSVPLLPKKLIITSFAGLRAHRPEHDFVIEEAADAPGFVDVAGMESPGLSSAPAVGEYVAQIVQGIMPAMEKENFVRTRRGIVNMAEASVQQRQRLIEQNPAFASVVCRCEMVTEGEIIDAIRRPCGATTVDGVKRRTRAGMGRCQSGFCAPKVMEILARELDKDIGEITKCGDGSAYLAGNNKEGLR